MILKENTSKARILPITLNIPYLSRILKDKGVPEATISLVAEELIAAVQAHHFKKEDLTTVFARHGIGNLVDHTEAELAKDPLVMPYGTLGMF